MDIERQYFRQWRSESSDSSYYVLPYGDEVSKEYGRAVCKEKCMKIIREGSSEYAAQCKEIAISDAVGTKFTHIITNVVSDGNDDSYYDSFEEAGINSERISLDHLAETREQAIKNMEEMADGEEEIGGGFHWDEKTYTLEEFKRILNSSDTLTEEQLECFHSVYCDYQGFGYFRGVAYIEEANESAEPQKNEGVIPEVHDSLIIRYKDKHDKADFDEIVKMLKDLKKRAKFITYSDIQEEFEGWKYSKKDIDKILNAVKADDQKNEADFNYDKLDSDNKYNVIDNQSGKEKSFDDYSEAKAYCDKLKAEYEKDGCADPDIDIDEVSKSGEYVRNMPQSLVKNEDTSAQWQVGTAEDLGAYDDKRPAAYIMLKDFDDSEEFCQAGIHKSDDGTEVMLSMYYDGYGDGYSGATVKAAIDSYNNQAKDYCLEKYGKVPYPPKEICDQIGLGNLYE